MSINETEQLLLKAVLANPADDTVRLVLADYWDDVGNHERAEFCRVQVELAGFPIPLKCNDPQCCYYANDCTRGCGIKIVEELRRRERELLESLSLETKWRRDGKSISGTGHNYLIADQFCLGSHCVTFTRGFVSRITCSWSDWLQHADAIRAAQPVERVRLTTEPEFTQPVVSGLLRKSGYRLADELVWIDHDELNIATDLRDTAVKVLSHRWRGIEFELPLVRGLNAADIGDLVNTTVRELGRLRFTEIAGDLQRHIVVRQMMDARPRDPRQIINPGNI